MAPIDRSHARIIRSREGGSGGQPETKSALSVLLGQPLGRVWVGLIGLGLLGFVAGRLAQSLADSGGHARDGKALAIRSTLGSALYDRGLHFERRKEETGDRLPGKLFSLGGTRRALHLPAVPITCDIGDGIARRLDRRCSRQQRTRS